MIYALEMFFDINTERKIMNYYTDIKENGISSYLLDIENIPHITIGVFNDIDLDRTNETLKVYCSKIEKFKIRFGSIGIFTQPKSCVFIAPDITGKFIELHKSLHQAFNYCFAQGFEYYLPDKWIPHCAVDISNDINVVCRSTEYLIKTFKPFEALITHIGWVEVQKPIKILDQIELI